MTIDRRTLLAGAGATAALAATPLRAASSSGPPATALLDAIAEDILARSPEQATSLGIDTGARAGLRARSSDLSPAGRAREAFATKRLLATLERIDNDSLAPAVRTDVEVTRTALRTGSEGFAFPYGDVSVGGWRNGPYVVAQNMGSYLDTPKFLEANHRIAAASDAEAYLIRLNAWADNLDGETARLVDARTRRVVAPSFVLDKTLAQLRATNASDVTTWPAVAYLAKASASIGAGYAARAETIARARIAPALRRQIAELTLHRAVAISDAGVWKLPDGDAYYAWALRAATTTRLTPDEVHRLGREELAVLQAKMDTILKRLGYTQGSVGARMTALGRDPKFAFAKGDAGRTQILAEIERRLADIRARLPRAFTRPPQGNVEVRRIAPAEEAGAPGAYGGAGSIDGTMPGRFWINLGDPIRHNRYSLGTLTYHESIPGHVLQGEYNQKLSLIRSLIGFSAYLEGWALYAEQLAGELGVYDDDPVGRLGYLQSIAFRACRLVVDTGLHAKRWTREQAIAWFVEANGSPLAEVGPEVDRYCVWPGQACGYKIGHSTINRLRALEQRELGMRYDLRAFNNLVVGGGAVPLTMLEDAVRGHIAARRA